jgi:hypothetical protein
MYELAAEAQAFRDGSLELFPSAFSAEGRSYWTPCFLRLARCYLSSPAGIAGKGGILDLEGEAEAQLLNTCRLSYGQATAPAGARLPTLDALGRLLEDNAFDLGLLARLAAAQQAHAPLAVDLFARVLARLSRPGVRAGVEAQLTAAQAGEPPERRLTYGQLELLFAKPLLLKGAGDNTLTPATAAAWRCGCQEGLGSRFPVCATLRPLCALPLVCWAQSARGLNARIDIASPPHIPRRVAAELLRRPRPGDPLVVFWASGCVPGGHGPLGNSSAIHDAIVDARRRRSPWFEAVASYALAIAATARAGEARAGTRLDAAWARPSAILECLRRAEEGRRRCKAILPTWWIEMLADMRATALPLRPWLERCQRRGDRLPAGAAPEVLVPPSEWAMRCSGCGEPASQLLACPCKLARYCRRAGMECHCVCVRASVVRQWGWPLLDLA